METLARGVGWGSQFEATFLFNESNGEGGGEELRGREGEKKISNSV